MNDDRELFAKYKLGLMGSFEDAIMRLEQLHDWDQKRIAGLESDIQVLKEEAYKDNQMSDMRDKMERMEHDYYQGFPICDKAHEQILKWQKQHIQSMHGGREINGINGGNWIMEFIPTSIGTVGSCICGSCRKKAQSLAFVNGEDWSNSDIAKKYLDLYDAKFNFQVL